MRVSLLLYITSSPDIKQILKSFVVDGSEKFTGCGRETQPREQHSFVSGDARQTVRYKSLHDCAECLGNRNVQTWGCVCLFHILFFKLNVFCLIGLCSFLVWLQTFSTNILPPSSGQKFFSVTVYIFKAEPAV
jgi:hypothetical protein